MELKITIKPKKMEAIEIKDLNGLKDKLLELVSDYVDQDADIRLKISNK